MEEARQRLSQITKDKPKYKKFMEGLITQVQTERERERERESEG